MSALQIVMLVVQASIMLTVFTIGLAASFTDVLKVLQKPGQLLRAVLAMFIVMPLLAVLLDKWFDLRMGLEVAVVSLAISPIPPLLPRREKKAVSDAGFSFGIGLMVVMAVLSVGLVPLASAVMGMVFDRSFTTSPADIALVVLKMVVGPLAAGIVFRRLLPQLAERLRKPVGTFGNVMLILAGLVILVAARDSLAALVGNGTLLALVGFVLAGLAVGHWLGGPEPHARTVLALSTACRHPGIAAAVANANFPGNHEVTAAIILYLLVNIVVCIPYIKWRRRHGDAG